MSADTTTTGSQREDEASPDFGCWKWIFIGLILLGAIVTGYLVLT